MTRDAKPLSTRHFASAIKRATRGNGENDSRLPDSLTQVIREFGAAMQNLALIGYRATGKTVVGSALAKLLGWSLIDTDEVICRLAGKSIREIFEQGGEAAFRDLEQEAVAQSLPGERTVVSLGGGAIVRMQNRQALRKHALTVWLQADPEVIWQRLQTDLATDAQRPALTDLDGYNEILAVLSERTPIYQDVCDHQVDTKDKSVGEIAEEILAFVKPLLSSGEV